MEAKVEECQLKRKIWSWISVVTMSLLASVALPAGAAHAEAVSDCSGSVIDSWDNAVSGTVYATTYLYWDGTYNCIKAVKRGSYYGKSSRIAVAGWTDVGGYAGSDDNYYLYYASFRFYGKGRCIAVETDVWNFSGANIIQDHVPASGYFHCG